MLDPIEPSEQEPTIIELQDHGPDERGASFSVPLAQLEFLGAARDAHLASVGAGHIRGNHFHIERRELIIVLPHEKWSLHWDSGEGTEASSHAFESSGAIGITIPPNCAHAIRNDGQEPLWLLASTNAVYDADTPDAHRRVVA